jgi:acetoin utilization protein AcuB
MMHVSELMSRDVVTIRSSESCREAVARMHRARVRHLPVVSGTGRLEGIVTDRDLRHRLFTPGVFKDVGAVPVQTLLGGVPVSAIMSAPVVTVQPADDLEAAARLMLERKVGALPVVDGDVVVGVLTETDLLRRIVQADAECTDPDVGDIIVSYP